jgi:uncharacterized protein
MPSLNIIFLDTSFIIAFYNKKDKNHAGARGILKRTLEKNQNTKFVFSDYIFDELITLLKSKKVPNQMISQIGDQILNSNIWKIVYVEELIFNHTWKMIKDYDDKDWSFTDTSSFALMNNMNILHYLSYDDHFEQFPDIQNWDQ